MELSNVIEKLPKWLIVVLLLLTATFLIYSHQSERFISWNPFGITTPVSEELARLKAKYETKRQEASELRIANENLQVSDNVIFDTVLSTEPLDELGIKIRRMAINSIGPFGENIAQITIHLLDFETDGEQMLDKSDIGLAAACGESPVFNHELFIRSDWVESEGKPFFKEKGLAHGFDTILPYPEGCTENSSIYDSKYEIWAFKQEIQERFRIDLTNYTQINSIAQLMVVQKNLVGGSIQ